MLAEPITTISSSIRGKTLAFPGAPGGIIWATDEITQYFFKGLGLLSEETLSWVRKGEMSSF